MEYIFVVAFYYTMIGPETSNADIFRSGTSKGFKELIPVGGQYPPNSGVGTRLEW